MKKGFIGTTSIMVIFATCLYYNYDVLSKLFQNYADTFIKKAHFSVRGLSFCQEVHTFN